MVDRVRAPLRRGTGTLGLDGDPVDAYVGPNADAPTAYVVHQKFPGTQAVDEDKVMLGFDSADDAERAYLEQYDGHGFMGGVTSWPVGELRDYLRDSSNHGKRLDRPRWVRAKIGRRESRRAVVRLHKAVGNLGAMPPAGAGWTAIPGGHHGGFRRPANAGGFEYWYPTARDHRPVAPVDTHDGGTVWYHGTRSIDGRLRGDAAGFVYLAEDPETARFYGSDIGQFRVHASKVVNAGDDPYDLSEIVRVLRRIGDDDVADDVEARAKAAAASDDGSGYFGVFSALRIPRVVSGILAAGYDAVRFRDDHDQKWKPRVIAVLAGAVSDRIDSAARRSALAADVKSTAWRQGADVAHERVTQLLDEHPFDLVEASVRHAISEVDEDNVADVYDIEPDIVRPLLKGIADDLRLDGDPADVLRRIGPPDEWSGGVADALGAARRSALRTIWSEMPAAQRSEIAKAFQLHPMQKAETTVRAHQMRTKTGAVAQVHEHTRTVKSGDVKPGAVFPMGDPEGRKLPSYAAMHVLSTDESHATVAYHHAEGPRQRIRRDLVPSVVHDLRGSLAHHTPTSGNKHVDAAIAEKGAGLIGKGNDGIVFHGSGGENSSHVVKASTVVPFQPLNGQRTHEESARHLDNEYRAHQENADDPMVPTIQRVHHEGRTWLVKPRLHPPGTLSKEDLDKLRDSIQGMHERGWAINDQIQVGRDAAGRLQHMDLGSASSGASQDDREGDRDRLAQLYRDNGQTYLPSGAELKRQHDDLHGRLDRLLSIAEKHGHSRRITHDTMHDRLRELGRARDLELVQQAEHALDQGASEDDAFRPLLDHAKLHEDIDRRIKALPVRPVEQRPMTKANDQQIGLFGETQQVRVKAHHRRTATGKSVVVREHHERRKKKVEQPKQRLLHPQPVHKEDDPRPTVVELFAGAGGMSYGLHRAGFRGLAHIEFQPDAAATLRTMVRRGALEGDVVEADAHHVDYSQWRGATLLAGGPPCQPFSNAGAQVGEEDARDGWPIFIEAVRQIEPRYILAENVRGMLTGRFAEYRERIEAELKALGYDVAWQLVNAADYGVPQLRERVILTASKRGERPFKVPPPDHHDPRKGPNPAGLPTHVTALDVADDGSFHEYLDAEDYQDPAPTATRPDWIKKHRPIRLVDTVRDADDEEWERPVRVGQTPLTVTARHGSGGVHLIEVPDFRPGARVQAFDDPDLGPDDEWGEAALDYEYDSDSDDPDDQIGYIEQHEARSGFGKSWGRGWMHGTVVGVNGDSIDVQWDGGDIEPWDRTLLVPERHVLKRAPKAFRTAWQSFPDDWSWQGSADSIDRQIGNAVPPLLAQKLGSAITGRTTRDATYTSLLHTSFEDPA